MQYINKIEPKLNMNLSAFKSPLNQEIIQKLEYIFKSGWTPVTDPLTKVAKILKCFWNKH